MSLSKINYTRNWEDPSDFPTIERNEAVVRADMQDLFDQVKAAVNALANQLESTGDTPGASQIGVSPIEGVAGADLQSALGAIKTLVDSKPATSDVANTYETKLAAGQHIIGVSLNSQTGVLTFTRENGENPITIDTVLEKVPGSMSLVEDPVGSGVVYLVIYDQNHQEVARTNVTALLTHYTVLDTSTIDLTESIDGYGRRTLSADVKPGSIGTTQLSVSFLDDINAAKQAAITAAGNAAISESNANTYKNVAKSYAIGDEDAREGSSTDNAQYYCEQSVSGAIGAQSYAKGGTGSRQGEDTDNAKYYKESAAQSATSAGSSANTASNHATNAGTQALKSEGYAVGTQGGVDPGSGPYHNNNAKYYCEEAARIVGEAGTGDMLKTTYDTNNNGVVDNAEKLGGHLPTYFQPAESGKGLSANDYSNTEKQKVTDNTSARHTHSNKSILDGISQTTIDTINNAAAKDGDYSATGLTAQYAGNLVGPPVTLEAKDMVFRPTACNFNGTGWDMTSVDKNIKTATVKSIKGQTLFFNQFVQNGNFADTSGWSTLGCTISASNNKLTISATTDTGACLIESTVANVAKGHKVLISAKIKASVAGARIATGFEVGNSANWCVTITSPTAADTTTLISAIVTTTGTFDYCGVRIFDANNGTFILENLMFIDLTKMYGAGNEPQTVGEFKAQWGEDYYPYTESQDVNFKGTGLKTNEFNQWDEQWEVGDLVNGEPYASTHYLRSKNAIMVFPNTNYHFRSSKAYHTSVFREVYYDANMNFISSNVSFLQANYLEKTFTTPSNAHYMKFTYGDYSDIATITTYDQNICINLAWPDTVERGYEPYMENTLLFNVLDYFPDGMNGVGTVCDELLEDKKIKKIGRLDLGGLNWAKGYGSNGFYCTIPGQPMLPAGTQNFKCARYSWHSYDTTSDLEDVMFGTNSDVLVIRDSSYSTPEELKASLSGVYLYYELADPVETPINPPLNLTYPMDDAGIEMSLPQNTSDNIVTAPLNAEIVYGLDYTAQIRNLPAMYANISFVSSFIAALSTIGLTMTANNNYGNWLVTLAGLLHAANVGDGTLGGKVLANTTSVATLGDKQVRNIYAGTSDMTSGTTALPTGDIYICYEA